MTYLIQQVTALDLKTLEWTVLCSELGWHGKESLVVAVAGKDKRRRGQRGAGRALHP